METLVYNVIVYTILIEWSLRQKLYAYGKCNFILKKRFSDFHVWAYWWARTRNLLGQVIVYVQCTSYMSRYKYSNIKEIIIEFSILDCDRASRNSCQFNSIIYLKQYALRTVPFSADITWFRFGVHWWS